MAISGDHDLGAAGGDAGHGGGERHAGQPGRAELGRDGVGEPLDLVVEEVQVGEDRADHERVVVLEAALQRLAQRGQLGAQSALGELGEHDWVGGARHERVEHRAPG